uniref:NADH-ubiquinone oxidoreductase chain 2 n=1 Tax=Pseudocolaspis sp. PSE01 TaxID=1205646 RepID=A0A0S2MP80_9CUCU|nr:NADH deshydrogenase subunit 2 [Pseudocolaspis sp. PSE01]
MKFSKMIFFLTMVMGTLITVSSYTWLSMWLGLEINLLSIIPLFKKKNNMFPTEATLKYFIIQSMASTMFMFSMILNMNLIEQINNLTNKTVMIIFYTSILTKMGSAPFHAWFPEVLEGLSWMNCLIMLTWQKLAPMIILMQNFKLNPLMIIIIILSSTISGIIGLNQVSMRKIMAYSSINHIAWMISSMLSTKMIWILYFLIYLLISLMIIMTLNITKTYFIHQMSLIKNNKLLNLSFNLNFLSLGGLPPFLGFFPKWLTINFLVYSQNYFMSTILILFTLVMLFIYSRIMFSAMTVLSSENLLKTSLLKTKFLLILFNFIAIFSLLFCPLIIYFI